MAEKLKDAKAKKQAGVHPEVLKSLIARCDGMKADMDEARGELGAAVKDAEETHGINRKAFKLVLSLKRMEQDKRDDFLRSLDDYREKLDLNPQADLFADDEGDEAKRRAGQTAKAQADDEAADRNSKALRGGIKQLDPAVH
ncbi:MULTISPECIES: hypothetical protein [Methylobacterium]|uniref:DUF2312 domain-containing protein n=1 Tax=Methylobacterium jeotgali TaxID=381630 RepID=A0ABQ4SZR0_9HYPH|nr:MULTISPECIES: hypothetical protein [Methylobacterium]PIU06935.1 MAG: hypothetical protein COT56_07335 [Methylobacterium sp. CG09_land_8_20_14_0_10_71_15]PIU16147.1 MAG: hypothetical protein COT28_01655 [Methylobacterium sp. CG08_land_8_20_14_0_20_71_15]GBU18054.1 hypothetical protein AwMethylo_22690 [Methylobacterium sp.]GJE08657.1 hypothetical protein AOPFMNJM_4000 [Methylobacterium jeotgali]